MAQEKEVRAKKATQVGSFSTASANDGPNVADALAKLEGNVKIIHGAKDGDYNMLVGQKVSTVRASLVDDFNIPGDAISLVNGNEVTNDYVLQNNDVLEFIKMAGVKGFSTCQFDSL